MSNRPLTGEELGVALMEFVGTLEGTSTQAVLAALSIVTASVACEAGYEEEKAVYAFRKCYGEAKRRIQRLRKELN
jgi:uncharacterized membrane protein